MTGIEVRDLCVRFDRHAPVLEHCSMSVKAGEIVALLGGSGSGKSTLLRAIAKLQTITSGEVELTGNTPRRRAGDLSYVFQDATLLPWRTAAQNVQLPLELSGKTEGGRPDVLLSDRVAEALTWVGLPEVSWRKYPRELSGGMRMRVSLARALVTDPAIMLFDEPFAALDEILRSRMNELLTEIWMRKRRTILFVTHNIAEAVNLSNRLAILGKVASSVGLRIHCPCPATCKSAAAPSSPACTPRYLAR